MKVLSIINNDKDAVTKEYVDSKAGVTAVDPTSGPIETDFFIPTKTSELTNDSGFITEAALVTKQDTLVSGTNIKTINNESLLGSGNISIQGASKYDLAQLRSLTDPSSDLYTGLITDIRNKKPIILYEEANGIYTKYMVISSLERQGMIWLFYQPDSAVGSSYTAMNVERALVITSSNGTLVVQEGVVPITVFAGSSR